MPVGDRPLLAHLLTRVARAAPVVVNAHHREGDVRELLARVAPHVALSYEAELLGTAGGLAFAAALLGAGDVLVWNGDIVADLDPSAILAAHRAGGAAATLVVRPRAAGEGNVGLDASGRVVRLRRETTAPGEAQGGEFLGVHVVGDVLRARLPSRGCLVGDVYLPALRAGAELRAVASGEPFWDVGTVGAYLDANRAWASARGGSWVAPSATVGASVRIVGSVVGEGAVVEGEGELAECVVWPGARARAPLSRAVVTPRGVAFGGR